MLHDTAQNSSNNVHSYPADNHHRSDAIYSSRGERTASISILGYFVNIVLITYRSWKNDIET